MELMTNSIMIHVSLLKYMITSGVFFYHFPSFDGVNTDVDESFPGISKAGVQCPVIQGSVACNG